MSRRLFFLLLLAPTVFAPAQGLQSSFSAVTFDRGKTPATYAGGVTRVDAASGAVSIDMPLGPGIGRGALHFVPRLRGRFAPELRLMEAYTPGPPITPPFLMTDSADSTLREGMSWLGAYNSLQVFSGGTANLSPGNFNLLCSSGHGGHTQTHFELPDGTTGSVSDAALASAALPAGVNVSEILKSFGYPEDTRLAKEPALNSLNAADSAALGEYRRGATGDELVLGLAAADGTSNAVCGYGPFDTYRVPDRILVVRGELAYEFLPVNGIMNFMVIPDSRMVATKSNKDYQDLRTFNYLIARILDRFGNSIDFTHASDGVGYTASWKNGAAGTNGQNTQASVTAEYQDLGTTSIAVPCVGYYLNRAANPPMFGIRFRYSGVPASSYRVEAITASGGLPSEMRNRPLTWESPATFGHLDSDWDQLRRDLQPIRVVREADPVSKEPEEVVRFSWWKAPIGVVNATNQTDLFYPSVLTSVEVPGLTTRYEWESYPWRPNTAESPDSGMAFYQTRPLNMASNFYGVSKITEDGGEGSQVRTTRHQRVVPVPKTDDSLAGGWVSTAFTDLVTHPDGTATGYRFYEPVAEMGDVTSDETGGDFPGKATRQQVLQTYAFLKHATAEIRQYAKGKDAAKDLANPVSTVAYHVEHLDKLDLHRTLNPQGSVLLGSVPEPIRTQALDIDSQVATLSESSAWDAATFGWKKHLNYSYPGQTALPMAHQVDGAVASAAPAPGAGLDRSAELTWNPDLALWFLNRKDSETPLDQPRKAYTYGPGNQGGLVATVTEGDSSNHVTTTFTYSPNGLLGSAVVTGTAATRSLARSGAVGVSSYGFDGAGFMTEIHPMGVDWHHEQTNDKAGRPVTQTDPNGFKTTLTWFPSGRLKTIEPDNREVPTEISYDPDGLGAKVTRGKGWSHNRFDGFGQLIETTRTDGEKLSRKRWTYDLGGRKRFESIWEPATADAILDVGTTWTYDDRGRLTSVTDPNGVAVSTTYLGLDRYVTLGSDQTCFTADALGRLVTVVDALHQPTIYRYDGSSQRLLSTSQSATDQSTQQVRTWDYLPGLYWLQGLTQPESGRTSHRAFHVNGSPTETWYGAGTTGERQVLTEFDSLGRLLDLRASDESVAQHCRYDESDHGASNNRLTTASAIGSSRSLQYAALNGRLSALDRTIGADCFHQGLAYDSPDSPDSERYGVLTSRTYPDGKVQTFTVNAATGLPKNSSFPGLGTTIASYDPLHWGLSNLDWGSAKVAFIPDTDQVRLKFMQLQGAGGTLATWNYGYDTSGRMTTDGVDSYGYDPLGRLRTALVRDLDDQGRTRTSSRALFQSFTYDAFGNRSGVSTQAVTNWPAGTAAPANPACTGLGDDPRSLVSYTLSESEKAVMAMTNQLPASVGGSPTGAFYDPLGNLLTINKTFGLKNTQLELHYDALGRVTRMFDPTTQQVEVYTYDDEGLRALIEVFQSDGTRVAKHYRIYNEARQLVAEYDLVLE